MIRINQMKLDIEHTKEDLEKKVLKTLRIKRDELLELQIRKQSVDAMKKAGALLCVFCRCAGERRSKSKKKCKKQAGTIPG